MNVGNVSIDALDNYIKKTATRIAKEESFNVNLFDFHPNSSLSKLEDFIVTFLHSLTALIPIQLVFKILTSLQYQRGALQFINILQLSIVSLSLCQKG